MTRDLPSANSPYQHRTVLRSPIVIRCLAMFFVFGMEPISLVGQEMPDKASYETYAGIVTKSQANLRAGRITDALQQLEATAPAVRGFEYEYLFACCKANNEQTPSQDLIRTIPKPDVDTRYGVLNKASHHVAFICRDGSVRVYDLKSPQSEPKIAVYEKGGAIWAGAFSADGTTFIAGYQNGDVVVWDAKLWTSRHTVSISDNKPVRTIAASPDGSAYVAEGDSTLELWSLAGEKPQKVADVGPRYNFGEGIAFSPQGDLIATGGMFDILIHDAKTGAEVNTFRHASYTMGLEFSPDGKQIVSAPRGNVNKLLAMFDIANGSPVFSIGPLEKHVDGLAFTPDGKRIIASGPQMNIRIFESENGVLLLTLNRSARTVYPAVSNDGRLLGWFESAGFQYIDLDANLVSNQ